MKNNTNKADAYRNLCFGKIDAPSKTVKNSPKAMSIKGKNDLRSRGGKQG